MKPTFIAFLALCLFLVGCQSTPKGINQTSKVKIGTPIWEFETRGSVFSSPAIGPDGTVISSGKKAFALNPDGTKKWAFGREFGPRSPAIGLDGTVYIGYYHGMFYAIDGNTGAKKWEFEGKAYPGASSSSRNALGNSCLC